MNEIIRDKYILEESSDNSIKNLNDEIEFNLTLTQLTRNMNFSTIMGVINDAQGNPVENAVVKLESVDKSFKAQEITDLNGNYIFEDILENFYIISIWAKGMVVQRSNQLQIIGFTTYTMNFTLQINTDTTSIITGNVFDSTTNSPIYNCVVLLFQIQSDGSRLLKATVYTNEFGQFAFRQVLNGEYFLIFNMYGYLQFFTNISIVNSSQISSFKINMIPDETQTNLIISGVILDSNRNPIIGAFVSLYSDIPNQSNQTVVGVTTTNVDGIYVFTNIPKGSYRVGYTIGNG